MSDDLYQILGLPEIAGGNAASHSGKLGKRIVLVKPPYFAPLTPPLGIAILKTFLEQHGFEAVCIDLNVDPDLWGMHHKYFAALQSLESVSLNDGYSKLWWILNAHLLAKANGADSKMCERILRAVIPIYDIRFDGNVIRTLIALVDNFYKTLDVLIDRINWADSAVVGTSTYTTSLGPSLFLLKKVKQKHPDIMTVMGGGIFADDLALGSDNLNTLLNEYPWIDHVVLGEGEALLLKLLQGELAHKRLLSLADLSGKVLPMQDIPIPDFSDFNIKYYTLLSLEGARSCPFQCNFCSETIQWGEYRKKPIELLADQMVSLANKYHNAFFMGDSLMNPYINALAENLVGRGANVRYDGYLRADKPVSNMRLVKHWSDSGLFRARLGIESGSARVLTLMNKQTTPGTISEALRTLAEQGIRTTTYWIVGFPGETEEDFAETCDFIREHHQNIYELEAHPYHYYPYGQVASRMHESYSLYPDDVTEVIKFRVWDIIQVKPDRLERYKRLRHITALATELGLPNIYSVTDRYRAEDRWRVLHHLATKVYQ